MKITNVLTLLLMITTVTAGLFMGPGCASIIPPTGGPRDSLPPLLLKVTPPDSTRSFAEKKIVFQFNEYIQLDNIQQNLIASPVPKSPPVIQAKLRTLTIEIKDTLEENTTYSFDFGNALKDLNEGNPYKNFTYLFSTGKKLDSLALGGKVTVAETGKIDTTLIVMLHTKRDDSAVIKDRPRYFARVKPDGTFRFHNLAPGVYSIYALKDEGARRYLSKEQLFAFYDTTVTSESMQQDIMLYAFTEKDKKDKAPPATNSQGGKGKGNKDEVDRFLKVQSSLSNGELDLLSKLTLTFSQPLQSFDSSGLHLFDEKFQPIEKYTLERDTTNTKVSIIYPWVAETKYNLLLDTTIARDSLGKRIARNDTLEIQTKKESDYGAVRLRFLNLDISRHPVLQFIQSDQVKFSHVFTNNQFNARLFNPGEYEMRLVYDENRNGVWDSGEFFGKHIQPEKVQLITRKLTVKANWDNEVDIQL